MGSCRMIKVCPFYNIRLKNQPAVAALYREQYCAENHEKCARFIIFSKKGPGYVPLDLFPGQLDRAQAIIDGTEPPPERSEMTDPDEDSSSETSE